MQPHWECGVTETSLGGGVMLLFACEIGFWVRSLKKCGSVFVGFGGTSSSKPTTCFLPHILGLGFKSPNSVPIPALGCWYFPNFLFPPPSPSKLERAYAQTSSAQAGQTDWGFAAPVLGSVHTPDFPYP